MNNQQLTWNFHYEFDGKHHSRTRSIIYKIENTISGKVYVGQTRRMLFERWANYKYDLLRPIQTKRRTGTNIQLKRSVQKHFKQTGNVDFLKFSIVEIIDVADTKSKEEIEKMLGERERHYIAEFRKTHGKAKVCNVTDGGRGNSFTYEGKLNISEAKKRFYQTEEGIALKEKLRKMQTNRKISEETRKKLSESHKGLLAGNKHPMFGKTGELNPMHGVHHTPESIEKIRQNRKGKHSGTDNHNTKVYDLSANPLVSASGETHTQVVCLNAFCQQHGLHTTHLRNVINGKNKSHKGWKLQSLV